MCSRNCCGVFWSAVLLVTLAFCLAFPWYGIAFKYNGEVAAGLTDDCERLILVGWRDMYCRSNCPSVHLNNTQTAYGCGTEDSKDHTNWRHLCSDDDLECKGATRLFDVAGALAGLSLACSIFSFLYFLLRCCCVRRCGKSILHSIITTIGFIFLIAAVGYFAHQAPKKFQEDVGLPYVVVQYLLGDDFDAPEEWCPNDGPCKDLFGSTYEDGVGGSHAAEIVWGPAGWIGACVVFIFYITTLALSCCRDQREYQQVDNEGTPYYGMANQRSYNSSGSTYQQSGSAPQYL